MSMARKIAASALNFGSHVLPDEITGESHGLLRALFESSTVGVAICDRQLRFRAVNDALASMNGIPAEKHIGRTIHAVLGKVASKVQPALEHVFSTGQPLSNFELTAELPSRKGIGHWSESYFPIKDGEGQVQRVGAIVSELTERNDLDAALLRLTGKLTGLLATLHRTGEAPDPVRAPLALGSDLLACTMDRLRSCLAETRILSQLLCQLPMLLSVGPPAVSAFGRRLPEHREEQGFAAAHPIAGETDSISPLSYRERQVMELLAAGRTNKEIAARLAISARTVESHRARIMLKLDLHSLSDLVLYAVRSHLIQA